MIVYYQFEVVMADDVVEENEICSLFKRYLLIIETGESIIWGDTIIRGARREGYKEVYIIISYSKATSNT